MKEFMMIFLGADYSEMGLSPEQMQQRMGAWMAWNQKMMDQGIVKDGSALMPTVKQISGKDRVVIDKTAAEVKELVGGYYKITAKSVEEAMEVAQDFPDYDLGGTVEIREVMVFE